jgi:integrase/recombinase XerD
METPLITVFVRHSAGCKYAGDEFTKRCQCKKHLRWTQNGEQFRRKTGSRSWAGAEDKKRELEAQLTGRTPEAPADPDAGLLLVQAIDTFLANKLAQGLQPGVCDAYKRQLGHLRDFSEARGLFTVKRALTLDNIIAYRGTWAAKYRSSTTRALVQRYLVHFSHFCHNAGWIDRVPKLSPIKIVEPETEPLTDEEYEKVAAAATGKTRTVIKLMRWSGLAVRDASTLKRGDLHFDQQTRIHKVIRDRTKTGVPLYIPLPEDVAAEVLAVLNGNPTYVFWNKRKLDTPESKCARAMSEQISAAFRAAGVESAGHMVSHRLRATFAVDLLQKGLPLEHVSKLLGHRSVTTTERHYAKWVKGRQDRLDALVSATWKT